MTTTPQDADSGFVKRGFYLLAGMGVLVCVVLAILFGRPATTEAPIDSVEVKNLSASSKGWEIRYAAVLSLMRRDSPSVPWETVKEMLNENQQLRNHRARLQDDTDVPNEAAARSIVLRALATLKDWHDRHPGETPPAAVVELYPTVDKLAQSPTVPLRIQALKTQEAIKPFRKS